MPFTTAMEISNIISTVFRVQYLKLCSNYGNTGEFLWRAVLYLQRHCKPNQNKQGNRVMRPKWHYLWTSSKHVIIDTQTIYHAVYILDITEFIKWVAQHNKKTFTVSLFIFMACLSFVIFISYQIESMAAQEEEIAPGRKKRKKKKKAKSSSEGAGGDSSEPVISQEPPKFEVKKIWVVDFCSTRSVARRITSVVWFSLKDEEEFPDLTLALSKTERLITSSNIKLCNEVLILSSYIYLILV